jgi:tetratricopeptide (TPR) repeat protein
MCLREASAGLERILGPDHLETLDALAALGEALLEAGYAMQSEDALARAAGDPPGNGGLTGLLGPNHFRALEARKALAAVRYAKGDDEAGLDTARATVKAVRDLPGKYREQLQRAQCDLGQMLATLGRFAEVRELLTPVHEAIRLSPDYDASPALAVGCLLAESLERSGDTDKAIRRYAETAFAAKAGPEMMFTLPSTGPEGDFRDRNALTPLRALARICAQSGDPASRARDAEREIRAASSALEDGRAGSLADSLIRNFNRILRR